MPFSASLVTAVAVQLVCQLFKIVFYSLRERRFLPGYFFSAGGIPSAHTAFVTALTVSIGFKLGPDSEIFAVSFVFSAIVIYDIVRVRAAVQSHSRILERLMEKLPVGQRIELPPAVGHTFPEVLIGLAVGGGLAAAAGWLLQF
jgi:acid phosphatase family membrane protein YuiD